MLLQVPQVFAAPVIQGVARSYDLPGQAVALEARIGMATGGVAAVHRQHDLHCALRVVASMGQRALRGSPSNEPHIHLLVARHAEFADNSE